MDKQFIEFVIGNIKEAIDALNAQGIAAGYPKQVEIERGGVKITVPWLTASSS